MAAPLLQQTDRGLYCAPGDFYIDPWRPVDRAIITHAHADHARPGHAHYLAHAQSWPVMQRRLGEISGDIVRYGEVIRHQGVTISLHPAGHILGSAQVRVESRGEVWVVTGDYKRDADATCTAFEPQRCHTLISEVTFGYPVYRWPGEAVVLEQLRQWWAQCRVRGEAAVLFCYALGKAQRLLHGLRALDEPVVVHGALPPINAIYEAAGVPLAPCETVGRRQQSFAGRLVMAPPSAAGSAWMKRFPKRSTAFASGWMQLRGNRRRRGYDRGFVLSDHADWAGLLQTVADSQAEQVLLTHGDSAPLERLLRERGLDARALEAQRPPGEDSP
ncbi:ligase-associated DNA damage response exonuclease [Abyssibacter profundi]|uniref:Ligase-associated DNA damage response exonuclease n=1 Tax=Abyssibacter profundi TaxID=2182787 RepID=A0A383XPT9_9GAMM|nr:ligase-associated DNA damage response exonuclease [Abyssibacter profundi]MBV60939.1 DNA ligase-associated DEXH box helicase [Nevskiales bacterium]PWN54643.1 ligase-associated DNA damage response exonuclease [Abyssibacter profundi]